MGIRYRAAAAGIIYLHLMLWGSLTSLVLAIYMTISASGDSALQPCFVLLFFASFFALAYILFHEYNTRHRKLLGSAEARDQFIKRPVYFAIRLAIGVTMAWLLSSGWNMIVAARQPVCSSSAPTQSSWQAGGPCIAQRTGTAISVFNLLSACALFTHMATSRDPFASHLFGMVKDRPQFEVRPYEFKKPSNIALSTNEKVSIARRRSASKLSTGPNKPLPKIPSTNDRPLTPYANIMGLGLFTDALLPVVPPMSQPPLSPVRPRTSQSASRPATPNTSPLSPYQRYNNSTSSLPGYSTPSLVLRPPPVATVDSAWRALHPPANHFQHVSNSSIVSRPGSSGGLASIRQITSSQNSFRTPSSRSYSQNSRNRSHNGPYEPISLTRGTSRSSSSGKGSRRGHVRCTSDPNEMISVQLTTKMELALRLERKLEEVQRRLDGGREGGVKDDGTDTAGSSVSAVTARKFALRKSKSDAALDTDFSKGFSALYQRTEWEILMGRGVG